MLTLAAPPSKSVSHRVFIAAALAGGTSLLHHALDSTDIVRTREVLRNAGAVMEDLGGSWRVHGMADGPKGGTLHAPMDAFMGESGTTCRLLTAVLAAGKGVFRIHGAPRMHERPLGALTEALASLGTRFTFAQKPGFAPMLMETEGLDGGGVELCIDESSQYLSGLLFAAPLGREPLRVAIVGRKAVSWPYIGLTLQTLEDFGIRFLVESRTADGWQAVPWKSLAYAEPGKLRITVFPGDYRAGSYQVEGDWTSASYLLAAGAAGQEPICVTGLRTDSVQGDKVMLDILRAMGAGVDIRTDGIVVSPASLHGIDIDMDTCPDLVPTVAMLAAFSQGATHIKNVAHVRLKECDRLEACAAQLALMDVRTETTEDSLTVFGLGPALPRVPVGTVFPAWNDHRMAMSAALFGLVPGNAVTVDEPQVVRKSFPDFWKVWSALA